MRLLVEEGGAFINVTDRWGNTPLDEANRAGARPCAAFLERRLAAQQRGVRCAVCTDLQISRSTRRRMLVMVSPMVSHLSMSGAPGHDEQTTAILSHLTMHFWDTGTSCSKKGDSRVRCALYLMSGH